MEHTVRIILSLFLVAAATHVAAEEPDLPDPPDGFKWQWCEDVRAAFLRRSDWYFKHGKQKDTYGYFITKEKINEDGGEFQTGLTVNVIPDARRKTGGKASDYAFAFFREAIKEKKNIISLQPPIDRGRIKTFGYRIKKDGTIVHSLLVADDEADKLYLILFESPEVEWDDAWKFGEPIMKKLYIEFPK